MMFVEISRLSEPSIRSSDGGVKEAKISGSEIVAEVPGTETDVWTDIRC